MNQTLYSIMLVYTIASVVYILFMIYQKIRKSPSFENDLQDNEILLNKYRGYKKTRTIVFIIGLLIGFTVILLFDNDKTIQNIKPIDNVNLSIHDIYVKN